MLQGYIIHTNFIVISCNLIKYYLTYVAKLTFKSISNYVLASQITLIGTSQKIDASQKL